MSKIACIGAGTVGRAWAIVFARARHDVALYDAKSGEVAERALPEIRNTLKLLAEGGLLSETVDIVLGRIHQASSLDEAVAGAMYIQESVREDRDVKRQLFGQIARRCPVTALLASSTSAIRGSEFMTAISHPERAFVAHPVNPPSLIPLVELCGTPRTSPEAMETARLLLTDAGMKPVVVRKEIDGFILNRLQYTLVAEALHLVGEGYCTAQDIDAVITEGLAPRWAFIGPFQVAHLNAPDGFKGFVDRLGPMMRLMGADARTDYDWTADLVEAIHDQLAAVVPVSAIGARQQQRDRSILALRRLRQTPS